MLEWLWLIPAFPIVSSVLLMLLGPRLSRKAVAALGVGSIGLSALVSILITAGFLISPPAGNAYHQHLWTWMDVAGFRPEIGLYLDALSLLMTLVVTFVSFFIHLYSSEFMIEDEGYSRFFAYMNLFVASMVTLLLADNLLMLYLGWEGVGLCSYLLIGFWYTDPANGRAAQKAFIVTRVGDTAMAIGLFLLFHHLGTLQIQELMTQAAAKWPVGSSYAVAAGLLLLGGAVGKSAQLPLQTWLPDAMAGPTPTSALIHAATMVTAGVYLVARTHVIYQLAPKAQLAVAVVGAVTLLMAGFSALTQSDIKRVLAYSTISQIGYMFLALGVGAWSAAIFHFMTHAFFKALLFLSAGVVIEALHHEHNMFKMGGLRKELPAAYWGFLIGGSALAGLPLVTAGFYSKGQILWGAWAAENGRPVLWLVGVIGVLLTSLYIFRLIFLVFYGELTQHAHKKPGYAMTIPLMVLAALSVLGGFVELPSYLGNKPAFSNFMSSALPATVERSAGAMTELASEGLITLAFLLGLYLAYLFFLRNRGLADALAENPLAHGLHQLWFTDWGMDWLYDRIFVRPVIWFAQADKDDFIDSFYDATAGAARFTWQALSATENGQLRWYAAAIAAGSVIFMAIVLFL